MSDAVQPIPERLGRYEIIERLAAGGMGEVFVARFVGPSGFVKPVALKRIHPELASDEALIHMLHDEANVAASIKHPNIVCIIDVGMDGGSHFVVLDYVSGEPLTRVTRELRRKHATMPIWAAVWICAEVASALHAAHEARTLDGEPLEIVHRDVSPANILLSDTGHPMLVDFGVAKARQRLTHTVHGELKGKIPYMAPEIFGGATVDRTVDVFALGVVLYELIAGASPFLRPSEQETIAALQAAEITPPSRLRDDVDSRLDPIILRAMARDRVDRYGTAAALERDLRAWARGVGARHDAASIAAWIAASFPERCAKRQALLARVASGHRSPSLAAWSDPTTQHSAQVFTPSFSGMAPATGAPVPLAPKRITPLTVSAGAVALGVAALVGWLSRGEGDAPAQGALAAPLEITVTPTAIAIEPPPPAASPASSASAAPSESAEPASSASATPGRKPRPSSKSDGGGKSKGPIVRSYDP